MVKLEVEKIRRATKWIHRNLKDTHTCPICLESGHSRPWITFLLPWRVSYCLLISESVIGWQDSTDNWVRLALCPLKRLLHFGFACRAGHNLLGFEFGTLNHRLTSLHVSLYINSTNFRTTCIFSNKRVECTLNALSPMSSLGLNSWLY